MQMGRVEICGKVTLPYISIHFGPLPTNPTTLRALEELALSVLLSGHGAMVTRNDDLVPCFDVEELQRRNRVVKRSS